MIALRQLAADNRAREHTLNEQEAQQAQQQEPNRYKSCGRAYGVTRPDSEPIVFNPDHVYAGIERWQK